jgi:DNA-binding CsgD family transcriptional regulator
MEVSVREPRHTAKTGKRLQKRKSTHAKSSQTARAASNDGATRAGTPPKGVMIDTSKWRSVEISPDVWLLLGADGDEASTTGLLADRQKATQISKQHRERLNAILREIAASARRGGAAQPANAGAARPALTPRQLQVARMVREGASNKEIARALNLSVGTVKVHLHRIYKVLSISNRIELAIRASD